VSHIARALLVLALAASACGDDAPEGWASIHASPHWWMSVTAPAADDRWIVGGTTTEGVILHWDGAEMATVHHGQVVPLLNWIHRFEDGSFVVAGNGGTILRGDGSSWEMVATPTDSDLWGVWASSPDDIWAVGGEASGGSDPVILRDTGDGFRRVEVPDLQRPGVGVFFKVWGSGPDDVFVVGQRGAVVHWDGATLTEQFAGTSSDLIGVWGTGPDRVVSVGGRNNAAIVLWDGAEWRSLDVGRFPGLNGVWLADDTVHVVGNDGAIGTVDFPSGEVAFETVDTPVFLHAINGTPDGVLTAVGGDFSTGPSGPFRGDILERTAP
jgi:hypothetical protein